MSARAALVLVAVELGIGFGLAFPAGITLWLAGGALLAWAAGTPCHDRFRPDAKPVDLPLPWLFRRRPLAPAPRRGEDAACRRECERLSLPSIRRLL